MSAKPARLSDSDCNALWAVQGDIDYMLAALHLAEGIYDFEVLLRGLAHAAESVDTGGA